jgi:hypothetical protein
MFRKMWRQKVASVLALLTGSIMWTNSSLAGVDADVRAALYSDEAAFGLGAGLLTNVGDSHEWFFNPNVEAAFDDDRDLITVNGDFHYDFAENGDVTFWAGGGPAIVRSDPDLGDSDTDLGLNLLTGLGDVDGSVRPYAQLRGLVSDENELVLAGGIRF